MEKLSVRVSGDVLVELRRLAELEGVNVQEKLDRILREALFGNYEVELKKAYSEKEVEILDRLKAQNEVALREFIRTARSEQAKVENSLSPSGKRRGRRGRQGRQGDDWEGGC